MAASRQTTPALINVVSTESSGRIARYKIGNVSFFGELQVKLASLAPKVQLGAVCLEGLARCGAQEWQRWTLMSMSRMIS